jgi:hypothetical protein
MTGLALNVVKTKYLLFSPRPILTDPVLTIRGVPLIRESEYKYLGVHIDDKLKFNCHILSIKSRLAKLCGTSFKIGKYLSLDAAKSFYFAMIQSILTYNIIFWGS